MALIIAIKVVPSSGLNRGIIDKNGTLKWFLKSAPERGQANQELIKTIAKLLRVEQAAVTILAGETSRNKKLKIALEITTDEFLSRCGVVQQLSLLTK